MCKDFEVHLIVYDLDSNQCTRWTDKKTFAQIVCLPHLEIEIKLRKTIIEQRHHYLINSNLYYNPKFNQPIDWHKPESVSRNGYMSHEQQLRKLNEWEVHPGFPFSGMNKEDDTKLKGSGRPERKCNLIRNAQCMEASNSLTENVEKRRSSGLPMNRRNLVKLAPPKKLKSRRNNIKPKDSNERETIQPKYYDLNRIKNSSPLSMAASPELNLYNTVSSKKQRFEQYYCNENAEVQASNIKLSVENKYLSNEMELKSYHYKVTLENQSKHSNELNCFASDRFKTSEDRLDKMANMYGEQMKNTDDKWTRLYHRADERISELINSTKEQNNALLEMLKDRQVQDHEYRMNIKSVVRKTGNYEINAFNTQSIQR
jgi:hypothetical protein